MTVCSSVSSSHGSHPKLFVNITSVIPHECSVHVLLVLPPHIIVDKFELPYKHAMWGHSDLELPVHALMDQRPTYVLLEVDHELRKGGVVNLEIPLHLRYVEPRSGGGYERVEMAWPMALSVCPSIFDIANPSFLNTFPPPFQSPFDESVNSVTSIPPCTDTASKFIHEFIIPIGNSDHLPYVQLGTAALVLFSFFWVGSSLIATLNRRRILVCRHGPDVKSE